MSRRAERRDALCARDRSTLEAAARRLRPTPADVFTLAGDIGEAGFLETLVRGTEEHFGASVDILVNNSGGPPAGGALEMTDVQWCEALSRSLLSVIRLSRLVAPDMKRRGWGRIINLTSMTAKEPDPGLALSNVARAGVSAFAKTLAFELGPYGITVNTILTGGVLTDRLRSLIERDIAGSGKTVDAAIEEIARGIPVRHIATPEEFAPLIAFIASDQSGYLNGVAIPLDGGAARGL